MPAEKASKTCLTKRYSTAAPTGLTTSSMLPSKTGAGSDIVSSPADADLVLEISWVLTDTGLRLPVLGQLRLGIIDPRTHVTLWNLTEYVRGAILLGNRDKNFDQAMTTILNRMKLLAVPAATPANASPR